MCCIRSTTVEMATELARSADDATQPLPITGVCIVADKNKCPKGFHPIIKSSDDSSDADLWRESSFSIFSRPVRYLAISRDIPENTIKGASVSVLTDITVVKESDPIPHGYIAIDYTADSKEKALRKRFLCIKTDHRESVVDAIGEITVLNKTKKTPKGFSNAGEVDGVLIVFRVVVIPQTFGITTSASTQSLSSLGVPPAPGLYPALAPSGSTPANMENLDSSYNMNSRVLNAFTIKSPLLPKQKGVDGVQFKLHPSLAAKTNQDTSSQLPQLTFDVSRLDSDEFRYNFAVERSTLSTF